MYSVVFLNLKMGGGDNCSVWGCDMDRFMLDDSNLNSLEHKVRDL